MSDRKFSIAYYPSATSEEVEQRTVLHAATVEEAQRIFRTLYPDAHFVSVAEYLERGA
jgi:hypothetical protein